jgi:hypothetical protein
MLFNIMPKITNPKGMAMINRGFINSLLFKALDSLWILEEGGGNRENVRCQTGAELHATGECVARSSYLLRAITALENAITETRHAFNDQCNHAEEGLLSNSGQF